jgi:hypothetical protein
MWRDGVMRAASGPSGAVRPLRAEALAVGAASRRNGGGREDGSGVSPSRITALNRAQPGAKRPYPWRVHTAIAPHRKSGAENSGGISEIPRNTSI